MPAEDALVLLPEPPPHLQPHLRGVVVLGSADRLGHLARQGDVETLQHRQRETADAVVGGLLLLLPCPGVAVDHTDPVRHLAKRPHLGVQRDPAAHRALKRQRNLHHAADRLEHRSRPTRAGIQRAHACPEPCLQQRTQVMSVRRPARAGRTIDVVLGVQIPGTDEERHQPLLVLRAQRRVDLPLVHRLGQQLRGRAPQVGLDLPQPHLPARQRPELRVLFVEVVGISGVDEDLERHAQLGTVPQHTCVGVGQSPRAAVEIQPLVELADLGFTVDLGVRCATLDGPAEPPHPLARFEHLVVVAQLAELVPHHEPGNTGTQHDDPRARPAALERRPLGGRCAHQPPGVHGTQHQRRPAERAEGLQDVTSGDAGFVQEGASATHPIAPRWCNSRSAPSRMT